MINSIDHGSSNWGQTAEVEAALFCFFPSEEKSLSSQHEQLRALFKLKWDLGTSIESCFYWVV